jgi:hypothetical protein
MRRLIVTLLAVTPLLVAAFFARADSPTDAGAQADGGTSAAPSAATLASAAPPLSAAPASGPPPGGYAPDPAPLVTRRQWVLDLGYREGDVTLRGARAISLPRATATPRAMGRFALELYVGAALLDRVRFDFPLLGAGEYSEARRRWDAPPSFERHLTSSAAVMIPQSDRTTRVLLVDRASGRTWTLPAPLTEAADAGVMVPASSK